MNALNIIGSSLENITPPIPPPLCPLPFCFLEKIKINAKYIFFQQTINYAHQKKPLYFS